MKNTTDSLMEKLYAIFDVTPKSESKKQLEKKKIFVTEISEKEEPILAGIVGQNQFLANQLYEQMALHHGPTDAFNADALAY